MRILKIVVLVLLIGLGLYVRFAPSDPTHWHAMPPEMSEDADMEYGSMRTIEAGEDGLHRLHMIVIETRRTRVLAGSVEEGMVTYIHRSLIFGFPDYTTIRQAGTQIEIFGRLRFGRSDFGVNATRIDGWIMRLSEGG